MPQNYICNPNTLSQSVITNEICGEVQNIHNVIQQNGNFTFYHNESQNKKVQSYSTRNSSNLIYVNVDNHLESAKDLNVQCLETTNKLVQENTSTVTTDDNKDLMSACNAFAESQVTTDVTKNVNSTDNTLKPNNFTNSRSNIAITGNKNKPDIVRNENTVITHNMDDNTIIDIDCTTSQTINNITCKGNRPRRSLDLEKGKNSATTNTIINIDDELSTLSHLSTSDEFCTPITIITDSEDSMQDPDVMIDKVNDKEEIKTVIDLTDNNDIIYEIVNSKNITEVPNRSVLTKDELFCEQYYKDISKVMEINKATPEINIDSLLNDINVDEIVEALNVKENYNMKNYNVDVKKASTMVVVDLESLDNSEELPHVDEIIEFLHDKENYDMKNTNVNLPKALTNVPVDLKSLDSSKKLPHVDDIIESLINKKNNDMKNNTVNLLKATTMVPVDLESSDSRGKLPHVDEIVETLNDKENYDMKNNNLNLLKGSTTISVDWKSFSSYEKLTSSPITPLNIHYDSDSKEKLNSFQILLKTATPEINKTKIAEHLLFAPTYPHTDYPNSDKPPVLLKSLSDTNISLNTIENTDKLKSNENLNTAHAHLPSNIGPQSKFKHKPTSVPKTLLQKNQDNCSNKKVNVQSLQLDKPHCNRNTKAETKPISEELTLMTTALIPQLNENLGNCNDTIKEDFAPHMSKRDHSTHKRKLLKCSNKCIKLIEPLPGLVNLQSIKNSYHHTKKPAKIEKCVADSTKSKQIKMQPAYSLSETVANNKSNKHKKNMDMKTSNPDGRKQEFSKFEKKKKNYYNITKQTSLQAITKDNGKTNRMIPNSPDSTTDIFENKSNTTIKNKFGAIVNSKVALKNYVIPKIRKETNQLTLIKTKQSINNIDCSQSQLKQLNNITLSKENDGKDEQSENTYCELSLIRDEINKYVSSTKEYKYPNDNDGNKLENFDQKVCQDTMKNVTYQDRSTKICENKFDNGKNTKVIDDLKEKPIVNNTELELIKLGHSNDNKKLNAINTNSSIFASSHSNNLVIKAKESTNKFKTIKRVHDKINDKSLENAKKKTTLENITSVTSKYLIPKKRTVITKNVSNALKKDYKTSTVKDKTIDYSCENGTKNDIANTNKSIESLEKLSMEQCREIISTEKKAHASAFSMKGDLPLKSLRTEDEEGIIVNKYFDEISRQENVKIKFDTQNSLNHNSKDVSGQCDFVENLLLHTNLLKFYNFDGILHKGQHSSILKARKIKDDKMVAVKILLTTKSIENEHIEILKKLTDADKAKCFSCIEFEYIFWSRHWHIVMDYYPLNMLQALESCPNGMIIEKVQELSYQLLGALLMLRVTEILHTDIKPSHILINTEHTKLKLTGFDRATSDKEVAVSPHIGTLNYRSPEIFLGISVGYPSDVWSTACTMFEMATKQKLFEGTNRYSVLENIMAVKGTFSDEILNKGLFSKHCKWEYVKQLVRKDIIDKLLSVYNSSASQDANKYRKILMFSELLDSMLNLSYKERNTVELAYVHPFIYERNESSNIE